MNILKKISIHIVIVSIFVMPMVLSAQQVTIQNPFDCGTTGTKDCSVMTLIVEILNNIIMPIAAVGIVLYIVYAGFSFVMAQGKPKEIEEAKQMLLWGMIGGGIILGAAGISKVVENTINSLIKP